MRSKKETLEYVMKAIEKQAKSFPKVKSLINLDGDDFSVDWKKVLECQSNGVEAVLCLFVSDVLLELEKLSWNTKGNYALMQDGTYMNPGIFHTCYFREKEDALEYKEALMSKVISDEGKPHNRWFPITLVQYLE